MILLCNPCDELGRSLQTTVDFFDNRKQLSKIGCMKDIVHVMCYPRRERGVEDIRLVEKRVVSESYILIMQCLSPRPFPPNRVTALDWRCATGYCKFGVHMHILCAVWAENNFSRGLLRQCKGLHRRP